MSPPESFDDMIGRLRAGDQDAAEEAFRRFATRVFALPRSRLDTRVRRKVDPEVCGGLWPMALTIRSPAASRSVCEGTSDV
jgi:hypothetical protein